MWFIVRCCPHRQTLDLARPHLWRFARCGRVRKWFSRPCNCNWGTCIASLLEERRHITESVRILVPVDRMKQKCFQITTKRVRQSQQFRLLYVTRKIDTWLSCSRYDWPVFSPLCRYVDRCHVWPYLTSGCKPWSTVVKDVSSLYGL